MNYNSKNGREKMQYKVEKKHEAQNEITLNNSGPGTSFSNMQSYPNYTLFSPYQLQYPPPMINPYEPHFPLPNSVLQPPPFPPPFALPPPGIQPQFPSFQTPACSQNFNAYNSFSPVSPGNIQVNTPVKDICSLPKRCLTKMPFSEDNIFPNVKKENLALPQVQLWRESKQFKEFYKLLRQLENDIKSLESSQNEMDENTWNHLCEDIILKKEKLLCIKQSLSTDSVFLRILKQKINKRKKKRKLVKKKKMTKVKMPTKFEIAEIHRQQMMQVADKKKQEDKLKSEADQVLSAVRQKKGEANYQINLLTALLKLHSARIQSSNTSNKLLLSASISGFVKVIEKLRMLWTEKLNEYLLEEKGLNVMLQDMVVTAKDEECTNLKTTFGKWLKFIFGTTDLQKGLYYSNFDELIQIREEWDKYIVDNETKASKIPVGWVIPKYHANDSWTRLIFEN